MTTEPRVRHRKVVENTAVLKWREYCHNLTEMLLELAHDEAGKCVWCGCDHEPHFDDCELSALLRVEIT